MASRLTTIDITNAPIAAWDADGNGNGPYMLATSETGPGTTSAGTVASDATIVGPVDANGNVQVLPVDVNGDPFLSAITSAIATALRVHLVDAAGASVPTGVPVEVDPAAVEYETVAASQTAQVLGATGAADDFLSGVLIIPASTSPGSVAVLDDTTSITIFAGGASSVSNLVPFWVPFPARSVNGAWKITTGANVSAAAFGSFT